MAAHNKIEPNPLSTPVSITILGFMALANAYQPSRLPKCTSKSANLLNEDFFMESITLFFNNKSFSASFI